MAKNSLYWCLTNDTYPYPIFYNTSLIYLESNISFSVISYQSQIDNAHHFLAFFHTPH